VKQTDETMVVKISCEEVWREISNYLEDETSAELRAIMQEHFKGCKHCTAVLDGTRNVVRLVGAAVAFELPAGGGPLTAASKPVGRDPIASTYRLSLESSFL